MASTGTTGLHATCWQSASHASAGLRAEDEVCKHPVLVCRLCTYIHSQQTSPQVRAAAASAGPCTGSKHLNRARSVCYPTCSMASTTAACTSTAKGGGAQASPGTSACSGGLPGGGSRLNSSTCKAREHTSEHRGADELPGVLKALLHARCQPFH